MKNEIRRVRIDYNIMLKELKDIKGLISLYHDQPLNIDRTSEYLGIKKTTLYQWIHQRRILHYRPGGKKVFFSRLELNKWAFMHKVLTKEEINEKANHYINWGKPDWSYEDYKLVYKENITNK